MMKTLEERVAALELAVEALKPIDLGDMNSEYNNPVIRRDPKQWAEAGGASYEGRRMSECPPDYLEALARLFDWQAKKDDEAGKTYTSPKTGQTSPASAFKRKDAARARAWAKKNAGNGGQVATRRDASEQEDAFPF